ncbi:MAG: hypothetical protein L0H73_00095 [Nitrococcus sp.]|nr:hypothetical protein [Nitrococcus sp.]
METLVIFLRLEMWLLLASLLLIVAYQILTGRINTAKMLCDKRTHDFSSGRVQLLTFTLIGVLQYVLQVAHDPTKLPDVPEELLLLLGGSNVLYLAGKASPLLALARRSPEP